MFAQRLAGHSAARITRALNDAGIPYPSAADPARNPHRTGAAWTLRTVAAILTNPRYTGRQVWNRQRTDRDLVDPGNTGLGHKEVQRWNLPEGWVIPRRPAHPALVSEADFIGAQDATAPRGPAAGHPEVPAGRAVGMRPVRAAARISLVQRQALLPVPPRPYQRHPPELPSAKEHLRQGGPDDREGRQNRMSSTCQGRRPGAGEVPACPETGGYWGITVSEGGLEPRSWWYIPESGIYHQSKLTQQGPPGPHFAGHGRQGVGPGVAARPARG